MSVNFLPQDPRIATPEVVGVPLGEIGTQLSAARLDTQDEIPVAQADANGNYLYDMSTPQFDQVNTHATVARCLLTYEHYTGHAMGWSFNGPLLIHPHAGEGKTAYYSRWDESINFFQWDSQSLGKTVKTSQCLDVASHEIGHALLDGIRPGLMGSGEGNAFHEGFGDSSAILHALQYDSNLEKILAENGGDFSQPSLITRLAEEFGTAFNKEDDNPNNDDHPYYRTALNEFKYVKPSELPSDSYPPSQPEEVLTSEAHSFSRIWSGAFYRMLGSLYNQCVQSAPSQLEALREARDVLGNVWGPSLDRLPAFNLKFRNAALGMLKEANKYEGGKYFDSLAAVMLDRDLLTQKEVDSAHKAEVGARLPAGIGTAEEAQRFLDQAAKPDGQVWLAEKPQAGKDGRQVLTFRAPQRSRVELGSLGPATLELNSGLTLVYDRDGQLLSRTYTPLTPEDVRESAAEARRLAASGQVAGADLPEGAEGARYRARLVPQRSGPPLFQPIPIWD